MSHANQAVLHPPGPPPAGRSWLATGAWTLGLAVLCALVAASACHTLGPSPAEEPTEAVMAVEAANPARTKLARAIEQAGTVQAWAQAELYSKASGYLLHVRRDTTPAIAASHLGRALQGGNPAALAAALTATARSGPQVDIGSSVQAGDLLLEIDVPERAQAVEEAEAALVQRQEELNQAHIAVDSFRAAVAVARARKVEASADVARTRSAYELKQKQHARVSQLARQRAIEPSLVDEKAAEREAALSTWRGSEAKATAAEAEVDLALARLKSAQGEVRVKTAQVRAATSEVQRARVMLDYGRLHAPFSGRITYRGVDEGDFIQNSRSGQSRRLMTITDSSRVKVVLQLPSREGALIRPGNRAEVTLGPRPGERYYGRVARTRGLLDEQSRTLRVEVDLDNRAGRLLPGMYVHVRLTMDETADTWAVPASALFSRDKVNYLVLVEGGVARRQAVRILFDSGDYLEVVKVIGGKEVPLDGSEVLVLSGKGAIAEGQRVRPVVRVAGR